MRTLLIFVTLSLPAGAFADGGFGYARVSSQLDKESRPARYQPLNLVDGRAATAWCEGARGDGVGQTIVFGFKEPVTIDEVRITNGEGHSRAAFKARNRVRKLALSHERARHTVTLADKQPPQVIKLDPPLETERAVLEVLEIHQGEGDASATCLTDVIFVSNGKPLSGAFLADRLGYHKGTAALMGSWFAGLEGAPDRFLDLYFDRTFRYLRKPFDPEEPSEEIRGEYAFDGERLRLKPSGKEWVEPAATLKAETMKDGMPRARLEIAAEQLDGNLAQRWSDQP